MGQENMFLGSKLIKTGSEVPDQKRIAQFDSSQGYLRSLVYRADRTQRADPLIRHTVFNKMKTKNLNSTGYGKLAKDDRARTQGISLADDHSSSVLFAG